jgi:1-deoxy-D-xylulose-5-phosphate reductoisomerase
MMKSITLLGSTGSIGRQTLEIIALHPDRFSVYALTANTNHALMLEQCLAFSPHYAVMTDPLAAAQLKEALAETSLETIVLFGSQALETVASHPEVDIVMASIVGAAGLLPNLAAARAGKTILLANKEALVMSGRLFMQAVQDHQATLLPVDSEHNGVFQCWQGTKPAIRSIALTASGGPFLGMAASALTQITPEQAVAHPRWAMGRKISVDSATLMNKGLEVIEASYLFDLPRSAIGVLLHPQSTAHAFVEYIDGSVLTHLGHHDMRVAISHALGYPERIISGAPRLALLTEGATLDFRPLKPGEFPCFDLCMQALEAGEAAIIALNAANEVAVQAFLNRECSFLAIARIIEATLSDHLSQPIHTLDDILCVDQHARRCAQKHLAEALRERSHYV